MRIARALADEIVQHAREEFPNECCGMCAIDDSRVVKLYPAENIHHSPQRFEIDGLHLKRILDEVDEAGLQLGIYHSHTMSAAYPSQTDVNFSELWPGVLWLIVSLQDQDTPDLRTFEITEGKVQEVEVNVE
jgi:[CysO sulfur-carrier protein]-S-L-cysteine hydrolase